MHANFGHPCWVESRPFGVGSICLFHKAAWWVVSWRESVCCSWTSTVAIFIRGQVSIGRIWSCSYVIGSVDTMGNHRQEERKSASYQVVRFDSANPCTVACEALLSMEFSGVGLPFASPEDLLTPGIKPRFRIAAGLLHAGRFFTNWATH